MSPAVLGYPRRSECFWQFFFFYKGAYLYGSADEEQLWLKPTELELELELPSEFPVCPWASKSLRSESETQGLLVWGGSRCINQGGERSAQGVTWAQRPEVNPGVGAVYEALVFPLSFRLNNGPEEMPTS